MSERMIDEILDLGTKMYKLRDKIKELRKLVGKQAEDEGLWFVAQTAPEAYLQQELRKLHAAIEQEEI